MEVSDINIIYVDAHSLKPAEYNPRQASEKECADLKASISAFGLVDPILCNSAAGRENIVIGGHFRLRMAIELGIAKVPVVYVNIPNLAKEQELNLRLNKNSGSWDFDLLANFDEDLLKDVGFDSKELDKVFQLDTKPEDDELPPERDETGIVLGDLWQLGEHRLLCGDSTLRADVERLMAGEKADMVFTDPPYGVKYEQGKFTGIKTKKVFDAIANDDKQADELFGFILDVASNAKPHLVENGCVYFWSPSMTPSLMILYALIQAGFHMQSQIVWVKNQFILGRCDYHWQHELCWYGYQGTNHKWYGGRTQSSVWNIDKDSHSAYKHPTQKPVALAERAINNSSDRENIVVDLFGGSGSTLIACESLKRRCFMMELDPIYCQVIIDRFEKYTGQKAVKI